MNKYNFDEMLLREGTNCLKYDARERFFGDKDVLPLWVADMDFKTPDLLSMQLKSVQNTKFTDILSGAILIFRL
ncbi:MAG TPA: hypothetical protein VK872_09830 [Draconibacterium sp.]|nr:hypothetical protein [Draconibacterium sp.]